MRKYILLTWVIFFIITGQLEAQTSIAKPEDGNHSYPGVPRVSAYEAYSKYNTGKALIFHAGGNNFQNRHIVGAINVDFKHRENFLNKFPKKEIEIFIYCY